MPRTQVPVRAYGPGLIGGIAGLPATFTVDSMGDKRQLGSFVGVVVLFVYIITRYFK
jgi:hypothetical protein